MKKDFDAKKFFMEYIIPFCCGVLVGGTIVLFAIFLQIKYNLSDLQTRVLWGSIIIIYIVIRGITSKREVDKQLEQDKWDKLPKF